MDRLFNKILEKVNPILKTSELPLHLLLQAEVSSVHQLHVGHPHWEYSARLWRGGSLQNGRIFFLLFVGHKKKWTIYWLLGGLWERELSICIHFILRSRTGVSPSCCSPPGHIRNRIPHSQGKYPREEVFSISSWRCMSLLCQDIQHLEVSGYLPEISLFNS